MEVQAGLVSALRLFPAAAAEVLSRCARSAGADVYEIRLYAGKAVVLCTAAGPRFCRKNGGVATFPAADGLQPDADAVWAVVSAAAGHAPFLHERELKNAYLTSNGCRVGVCGFAPDGRRLGGGVTSVNIRVPFSASAYEMPEECVRLLRDTQGLLVVGPPACGKTTFLKKCVSLLSGRALGWRRVAVIDERDEFVYELAGDTGAVTADLIRGVPKAQGIQTALRLFSPEYILCDEIGGSGETRGMLEGLNSGVRFIASMHACGADELLRRRQFRLLWDEGVFEHILFLSAENKGTPARIVKRGEPL